MNWMLDESTTGTSPDREGACVGAQPMHATGPIRTGVPADAADMVVAWHPRPESTRAAAAIAKIDGRRLFATA
jgi:hypothetical protein